MEWLQSNIACSAFELYKHLSCNLFFKPALFLIKSCSYPLINSSRPYLYPCTEDVFANKMWFKLFYHLLDVSMGTSISALKAVPFSLCQRVSPMFPPNHQ